MGILRMKAGSEMTVHAIGELAPRLLDAARSRAELQIDLSDVQRCDTAGVQLLLMLQREARRSGTRLHFTQPSPALAELLEFYRCRALLDSAAQGAV